MPSLPRKSSHSTRPLLTWQGRSPQAIWDRAGQPIGRCDPMIAAIAIIHGLELVTGNTSHYQRPSSNSAIRWP